MANMTVKARPGKKTRWSFGKKYFDVRVNVTSPETTETAAPKQKGKN